MTPPPARRHRAGGLHDRQQKAQPMTNLEARIECLPTDVLANVCCGLMNDFRPEADTVFAAALAECQKRMTSPEFLALCDRMEAAA